MKRKIFVLVVIAFIGSSFNSYSQYKTKFYDIYGVVRNYDYYVKLYLNDGSTLKAYLKRPPENNSRYLVFKTSLKSNEVVYQSDELNKIEVLYRFVKNKETGKDDKIEFSHMFENREISLYKKNKDVLKVNKNKNWLDYSWTGKYFSVYVKHDTMYYIKVPDSDALIFLAMEYGNGLAQNSYTKAVVRRYLRDEPEIVEKYFPESALKVSFEDFYKFLIEYNKGRVIGTITKNGKVTPMVGSYKN